MEILKYTDEEGEGVYCDAECELSHRPDHEQLCLARQERKTLLRIATILKSAIIAYLECAFDLEYRDIVVNEGIMAILEGRPILHRHISFPSDLTTNMEHIYK